MRLLVEGGLPFAGGIVGAGGELDWPKTLQAESEVLDIKPSQSRPDRVVAIVRSLTRNQRNEVVQRLTAKFDRPSSCLNSVRCMARGSLLSDLTGAKVERGHAEAHRPRTSGSAHCAGRISRRRVKIPVLTAALKKSSNQTDNDQFRTGPLR